MNNLNKFKNPYYKKIRGSVLLELTCAHCKTALLHYQKVVKGNVRLLHLERIVAATFDCFKQAKQLTCPTCGTRLGLFDEKHFGYRMIRGHTMQRFLF